MRHPLGSSAAASLANNCENKRNMTVFESKASPWRFKTWEHPYSAPWNVLALEMLHCVRVCVGTRCPPELWQGEEEWGCTGETWDWSNWGWEFSRWCQECLQCWLYVIAVWVMPGDARPLATWLLLPLVLLSDCSSAAWIIQIGKRGRSGGEAYACTTLRVHSV